MGHDAITQAALRSRTADHVQGRASHPRSTAAWVVLVLAGVAATLPLAGAVSVSVDAPGPVPLDGTPFDVHVRLEDAGERSVEVKLWLGGQAWQASRTWNGSGFERSDRYVLDVDPTGGRFSGWIPLEVNTASANHEDLVAAETAMLGARVRGDGGVASATSSVATIEHPEHRLVGTPPGGSVWAITSDGQRVAHRTNLDDRARVLEVALGPGFDGAICPEAACPADGSLVLDRVAPDRARVRNVGSASVDLATSVVVLETARCALTGELGPGATVTVLGPEAEPMPAGDGLASAGSATDGDVREPVACPGAPSPATSRPGRLWQAGDVVDAAPDPPGWGDAVREPWGKRAWSPWRLPRGVEPALVTAEHVAGGIAGFDTREEGLARVLEAIRGARERLSVATYLFTNGAVADALVAAQQRGVDVEVLLEPTPVGGLPDREQRIVQRLEAAGVEVRWFGGPIHKHGLQHAKVLVVDGAVVLVLTENLTHSGLPSDGDGNLGLGLGIHNGTLARRLEAHLGFQATPVHDPWRPATYDPFEGAVTVLTSPENAWRDEGVPAWLSRVGRVDGLALRIAPDWGPRQNAWLSALAEASQDRPVRVLASGVPGSVREANRVGLSVLTGDPSAGAIETRLSGPDLGTVHAKAILAGDSVLVGSTNWGMGGVLLNREVNLIVEDPTTAAKLGQVFDHAWNGSDVGRTAFLEPGALPVPGPGPALGVLAALVVATLTRRALSRDPGRGSLDGPRRSSRGGTEPTLQGRTVGERRRDGTRRVTVLEAVEDRPDLDAGHRGPGLRDEQHGHQHDPDG